MASILLELIDKYFSFDTNTKRVIIFYNCSDNFASYLTQSGILREFIIDYNSIIILRYNEIFSKAINFYKQVIYDNPQEILNSYTYCQTDYTYNIEEYYIIYNNTFIELNIYHDDNDITTYMTIDGIYTPIPFITELTNLDITHAEIYKLITNYIDDPSLLQDIFNTITI